ncbi:MAG: TetR/AcrR family transcriptional regulator [Bacteroidaceae bacterium]
MTAQGKEISRRDELRTKIEIIAKDAFIQRGIKRVTMDEIAFMLGISKRTLYEIFSDKETLLVNCLVLMFKDRDKLFLDIYNRSSNILETMLFSFQKSIELMHDVDRQFFIDIKMYPRAKQFLEEKKIDANEKTLFAFNLGKEQGIFRADINSEIIVILLKWQFDSLRKTKNFQKYSFLEIYESIMFTLLRGIINENSSDMLEDFILHYRESRGKL